MILLVIHFIKKVDRKYARTAPLISYLIYLASVHEVHVLGTIINNERFSIALLHVVMLVYMI